MASTYTNHLRPLGISIIETLTRDGGPQLLAALAPTAASNRRVSRRLDLEMSLARPELSEHAAEAMAETTEWYCLHLLNTNPELPENVLTAALDSFVRNHAVGRAVAAREDLTPKLAVRLARRARLRPTLAKNPRLPAQGAWNVHLAPKALAGNARFSTERAYQTAQTMLKHLGDGGDPETLGEQLRSSLARSYAGQAMRVIPDVKVDNELRDAIAACMNAGLLTDNDINSWLKRSTHPSAAVAGIQIIGARAADGVTDTAAAAQGVPVMRHPKVARAYVNQTTYPNLRAAALAHPACAKEASAAALTTQLSVDEEWAVASNPKLSAAAADHLARRMGTEAWSLACCENLTAQTRMLIASGPAGAGLATRLARELDSVVLAPWVHTWLDADLVLAMLSNRHENPSGAYHAHLSKVLHEAVRRHPARRAEFVDFITLKHRIGDWEAYDLVDGFNSLTPAQLIVVAGLAPNWDGPVVELIETAVAVTFDGK